MATLPVYQIPARPENVLMRAEAVWRAAGPFISVLRSAHQPPSIINAACGPWGELSSPRAALGRHTADSRGTVMVSWWATHESMRLRPSGCAIRRQGPCDRGGLFPVPWRHPCRLWRSPLCLARSGRAGKLAASGRPGRVSVASSEAASGLARYLQATCFQGSPQTIGQPCCQVADGRPALRYSL